MIFFLIAMYFNGGLVPTYLQVMRLGMLDTIWAMILPTSVSVYNLIIARTFFASTIPDELREAAQLGRLFRLPILRHHRAAPFQSNHCGCGPVYRCCTSGTAT